VGELPGMHVLTFYLGKANRCLHKTDETKNNGGIQEIHVSRPESTTDVWQFDTPPQPTPHRDIEKFPNRKNPPTLAN
jgi:hypothetical protein